MLIDWARAALATRRRRPRYLHTGMGYLEFLAGLHARVQPRSYLEIGTRKGRSLTVANCASIAVDPTLQVSSNVIGEKPSCLFVQATSDAFFESGLLRRVFSDGVDLAFLDGLHNYEVLLRDFMNTERNCHPRSLIILHDCLPPIPEMAERTYRPSQRRDGRFRSDWTGDVWKLLPILTAHRPDIRIVAVDAPPSGLVICGNLDPASTVLAEKYEAIVEGHRAMSLEEFGMDALFGLANLQSSHAVLARTDLGTFFMREPETAATAR
jgi:hypothetical protein